MNRQKIKDYLKMLIGKTLDHLNLACDMMMFTIGNIAIHSQCFTRIMKKNEILLTTLDYQSWDEETNENNDEWYNLSLHKDSIINTKVINAQLTDTNDILIWLENDIHIQIFISNGAPHYSEEREQWRIFEIDNEDIPHIVVYAKTIQD